MRLAGRPPSGRVRSRPACRTPVRRSVIELIRDLNERRKAECEDVPLVEVLLPRAAPTRTWAKPCDVSGARDGSACGLSASGLARRTATPSSSRSVACTETTLRCSAGLPSVADALFDACATRPTVVLHTPTPPPRAVAAGEARVADAATLSRLAARVMEGTLTPNCLPLLDLHAEGDVGALHVADVEGDCLRWCPPHATTLTGLLGLTECAEVQLHLLRDAVVPTGVQTIFSVGEDVATRWGVGSRATTPATGSDFGSTGRDTLLHTVQYQSHEDGAAVGSACGTTVGPFCVALALYAELTRAGFFDAAAFPWVGVCRVRGGALLEVSNLRVELRLAARVAPESAAARLLQCENALRRNSAATVPVGVARRMCTKGVLRHPPTATSAPSLATAPFTDGELFQLLYLQLVLRAVCDVRLPHLTTASSTAHDTHCLRTDLIAFHACRRGGQALAFEHPTQRQRWLLFTRHDAAHVLALLDLQHAVVPHLASAEEERRTACCSLLGSEPHLLPCRGPHGTRLVRWAATQRVDSPHSAFAALVRLFDELGPHYGCDEAAVWRTQAPVRVFYCGATAFAALHAHATPLTPLLHDFPSCLTEPAPPVSGSTAGFEQTYSAARDDAVAHISPTSPFTHQASLVVRWRQYIQCGEVGLFYGTTEDVVLHELIGVGGSGRVYRGCYGPQQLPVAVKVFVIPHGMSHEAYVRESLTDVAFYVLLNQLSDFGVCATCRAHNFVVSDTPPRGLSAADVALACHGGDRVGLTKLCYLITDLMDGALGRFLEPGEADYDPCYDTLVNSPLHDAELFQLLYAQLVSRAVFDWKVLDVMLNGQLRGDNLGFRLLAAPADLVVSTKGEARHWYEGILVQYRHSVDAPARYLRFPARVSHPGSSTPLPQRCIFFVDLGQGMQPDVLRLTRRGLIGQTVVESCVTDDGLGRYWPLDELYCKYVDVQRTALSERVVEWGTQVRLHTPDDARRAMEQLIALYATTYSVDAPTEAERSTHLLLRWDCDLVEELVRASVYSEE